MKAAVGSWLLFGVSLAAQPQPGTGSIEGRVPHLLTAEPVGKATVELISPQFRLNARTDAAGSFQFSGLPAASYTLRVARIGFVDRNSARPLVLRAGGLSKKTEIRLAPQGSIGGRVLDEDGDAVGGANVWILRQSYESGRKRWSRIGAAKCDEAGRYRFGELPPGRYLAQAMDSSARVNSRYGEGGPQRYAVATPVDVGVGSAVRGVDIRVVEMPTPPSFTVRGRVTGVAPNSGVVVVVSIGQADGSGTAGQSTAAPDYAFELRARRGENGIRAKVYSGSAEAYGAAKLLVTEDASGWWWWRCNLRRL